MRSGAILGSLATAPRRKGRLRAPIVLLVAGVIFAAVISVLALIADQLVDERGAVEGQALMAAVTLAQDIDQEFTAAGYLLKGLSTSPALQSGDLEAFYNQLMATAVPDGASITVWDARQGFERQILNTRQHFGAPLPTAESFGPDLLDRIENIRQKGLSISNRAYGPVSQAYTVAVSLRIDGPGGDMKYFISTILTEKRLKALFDEQRLRPAWTGMILDRQLNLIAANHSDIAQSPPLSKEIANRISGSESEGKFISVNGRNLPVFVAYKRAAASGWTAITEIPLSLINEPVNRALWLVGLVGTVLLAGGVVAASIIARRLEQPIDALCTTAEATQVRYQTYWEHTPECLFAARVTGDGEFVYDGLNPAHERLSGLSSKNLAGRTPRECFPADTANKVSAHYRDCVEAGRTIRYEEVLDFPGGIRRWETTLAPVRDPHTGRTSLILGNCRDITQERDAAEQIDRGRRLVERIAAACPEFIYVYDLKSQKIEFISSRVRDVLGYEPDHLLALTNRFLHTLVHRDDRASVAAYIDRLRDLSDNVVASVDCQLVAANQECRWFRTRDMVFSRADDGHPTKIIGVAVDVADLKAAQDALAATNERLRSTLSSISDCYATLDRELLITDINDAALQWLKMDEGDVIGKSAIECFPNFPLRRAGMTKALARREPVHLDVPASIYPGRWLDFHIYPSSTGFSVFFRDISERKLAELALEKTKGLLNSTLNALSAHIVILDEKGTLVLANEAWRRFLRRAAHPPSDDGIGANYLSLKVLVPTKPSDARKLRAGLQATLDGTLSEFRGTYEVKMNGDIQWYQIYATSFHTNGWTRIVVAHEDVTEVRHAQRTLDDLSQRLLKLQEEERARISVELHDSTSQHLVAIGLNLMRMRDFFKEEDIGARKLCDEIEGSLDEAQREIRAFTYLLHPPNLDADGLKHTIERFVDGFSRRTSLNVHFTVAGAIDGMPFDLRRSVLRVVQEALANVHHHASATKVAVNVAVANSQVEISIVDDGRGMGNGSTRPNGGNVSLGVGIPGMRARVEQYRGVLNISSGESGTIIKATIPLAHQPETAVISTKGRRPRVLAESKIRNRQLGQNGQRRM